MTRIVVTGSKGFIGRHIMEALTRTRDVQVVGVNRQTTVEQLSTSLLSADVVIHLAGVNRPTDVEEFDEGNAGFTATLCECLLGAQKRPLIVFASSVQAVLDTPYGRSKRKAELAIADFTKRTGHPSVIFRLKNVFGKWCRPNYNSVVATFCFNLAHGVPLMISDPLREIELVYIDDVVSALLDAVHNPPPIGSTRFQEIPNSFTITLGNLATQLRAFQEHRTTLLLPCFQEEFMQRLYATYLSYIPPETFVYCLNKNQDERGALAEFLKSPTCGQVFVSRTRPGITRGNHFHHTKTEKFFVLEGDALIRFRQLGSTEIIEHRVAGHDFRVVDIPPGYTHSIQNIGSSELVVLFWASQIFDPKIPDTIMEPVLGNE